VSRVTLVLKVNKVNKVFGVILVLEEKGVFRDSEETLV